MMHPWLVLALFVVVCVAEIYVTTSAFNRGRAGDTESQPNRDSK